MAWFNYNTVQDDLVAILAAGVTSAELVKKEADDRDYAYHNMPLIDVRLKDSQNQLKAGGDNLIYTTFEVQVTVYDLSSFDDAAKLRDTVLGEVVNTVWNNNFFSSLIETSTIGEKFTFNSATDPNGGAFLSSVVVDITTQTYVDRNL